MSLTVYLWGIRLFTLLSFSAWIGIVVAVDPTQAGTIGEVLFFTSLFAFLVGVLTLVLMSLYCRAIGATSAAHHLGSVFRQASLLSILFIGIILFQKEHILNWWVALLLFAGVLTVEFSLRKIFSSHESV